MNLTFEPEAPPLRVDEAGAVRVGKTRVLMVLMVLVVHAFQDGESPEDIVRSYPSLTLAEVYAVIAYYLWHTTEVDEYLAEYKRQGDEIRRKIEAIQGSQAGLRDRLLAGWRECVAVADSGAQSHPLEDQQYSPEWCEVWADDSITPPYLLMVRPDNTSPPAGVVVIDPQERSRVVYRALNHLAAKDWLLEDEYSQVRGRFPDDY